MTEDRDNRGLSDLGQDGRVKRSRMMTNTGTVPTHVRVEVLKDLRAYMKDADISQAGVAKAIGTSATYLSDLLAGRSAGMTEATASELIHKIGAWLDREARARDAARPEHFVTTAIAKVFANLAEMISERATMAACWGPSGIGKSKCLEAIAPDIHGVLVRVHADNTSKSKFLTMLETAADRKGKARSPSLQRLAENLRRPDKAASPNVLLVDEAHRLAPACYDMLRDLHEIAQCSVLLSGTYEIIQAIDRDDEDGLGQMSSRVSVRVDLLAEANRIDPRGGDRLFTVAEVRAVLERMKLRLHPDAARMMMSIVNGNRGHLRVAEDVFFYAHRIAMKTGATQVMVAHIEKALLSLSARIRVTVPASTVGDEAKAVSA